MYCSSLACGKIKLVFISAQEERLASLNNVGLQKVIALARNDSWNLDLHGLHAAEALHFLEQHLHRIETHFLSKLEPSYSSLQHKRPTSVQVITGVGNHSRGQASLPTAVRGFLNENGYHFEELKPGVVTIQPKFRISS